MALAVQALESTHFQPVLSTNPVHPNGWPVRLVVSSQTEARHNRALWAPTHLISIRAPGTRLLSMIDLPPERHLELHFGDTTDPDAPDAAPLQAIEATLRLHRQPARRCQSADPLPQRYRALDGPVPRRSGALRSAGKSCVFASRAAPGSKAKPARARPLRRGARAQGQTCETGAAFSGKGLERLNEGGKRRHCAAHKVLT